MSNFPRNCTIATVILFGDIVICLSLLIPMFVQRKSLLVTILDKLTFSLVSSGLVFSTIFFIINIRNMSEGGMTMIPSSCSVIVTLIFLVMGAIMWIHTIISVERYFLLVHNNKFKTVNSCLVVILSIYSFLSIASLIFLSLHFDNVVAFESEWWCFLRFTSTDPWHIIEAWILLAYIFFSSSTIIFCYFSIYLKVKEMKKQNAMLLGTTENSNVANKFLVIFVAFCLTYTPSFLTFIYRFIFKANIPPSLEFACSLLPTLEAGITCTLLFYLNRRYREAFKGVILGSIISSSTFTSPLKKNSTTNGHEPKTVVRNSSQLTNQKV